MTDGSLGDAIARIPMIGSMKVGELSISLEAYTPDGACTIGESSQVFFCHSYCYPWFSISALLLITVLRRPKDISLLVVFVDKDCHLLVEWERYSNYNSILSLSHILNVKGIIGLDNRRPSVH